MVTDKALFAVRVVGFANFLVLAVIALWLGGDAFNGQIDGGHYYLGSHGRLQEVSRLVWTYSYAHVLSNFVTFPLAFAASVLSAYRRLLSPRGRGDGPA